MTAHRVSMVIALSVAVAFWLLGFLDPQLFFVHFYESLIYLLIATLLVRFEDRWACMLGMLGPAAWLVLILLPAGWAFASFAVGTPPGILQQVSLMFRLQRPTSAAIVAESVTLVLSALMIGFSMARWRTQRAPRVGARGVFLACLIAVAVYYGVLVMWLLRWKPLAA